MKEIVLPAFHHQEGNLQVSSREDGKICLSLLINPSKLIHSLAKTLK